MNYFWDDQFHLYRSKNPGEFSYSDGVEVEERLLSIVSNAGDRSTFSLELASSIHNWPTEYHFSRLRHCLVRPLNIQPADKVLELGCGCGAITRFLGEVGASVVAVEGSLLRGRVAAERCRELTNVRVVVDDLLRFETDELFDCILLIGVLEYAGLFSDSDKPFEEYLQTVTRFLAPGGRVVVAIENKVGLKYFNGCAEDHVGVPFFGVQDLYGPGTVRTFGRQELIALLSAVGLSEVQFYYPFPDYKLPSVLLSESALTEPGFDAVDLLTRCHARDYTGSPYRGFDEALAFSELHTNGLLSELSNSFLVVATPEGTPSAPAAELAFAWSVNRAPGFCTQTTFGRRRSDIVVMKKLLTPSADSPHQLNENLTITHNVSDSTYRPGRQELWRLLRAKAVNGDLESIVQALRPWMEFLLQRARIAAAPTDDVLEKPRKLASYVLAGYLMDCTPFNLLSIGTELVPIDVEWQSVDYISLGWVITRGILWSMSAGMASGRASLSLMDTVRGLCNSFDLEVRETDVESWLDLEEDFQELVTGLPCEPLTKVRTFGGMVPFVSEISNLKQRLGQRAEQVLELEQAIAARDADITNLRSMVSDRDEYIANLILERDKLGKELSQLQAQDSSLKIELTQRTEELSSILQSRTWRLTAPLRAIRELRSDSHPELDQLKKDKLLISQSPLFDVGWYLEQNPDVAQQGADPVDHYIHHGAFEGRDPSQAFSSNWYLEQNPDVRAAGFNPLVHYLRYGVAEGRRASPPADHNDAQSSSSPADVFSYMSTPVDFSTLPKQVFIGVSSRGNFFMAEIARMIEDAFKQLGVDAILVNESQACELPPNILMLVVAPHEFFHLGEGPKAFEILAKTSRLVMVNTEQPQTQWFELSRQYLGSAIAVLDIDFESARHLQASGHVAFALPLGYSEYIARTFNGETLPPHDLYESIPSSIIAPLPQIYSDRPIDVLFIGTASPRRHAFFANYAPFFSSKNTIIYMPDGHSPFLSQERRAVDFTTFVALVRRSKILLNIHRDNAPYLEWQRIVTLGIAQKTLIITDHCSPNPCIVPNLDYLDGPLEALPTLCDIALGNPAASEHIAAAAYHKMQTRYPMDQILGRCWTVLSKTVGIRS